MSEWVEPYEDAGYVQRTLPGRFGFTVEVKTAEPWFGHDERVTHPPQYTVCLPHQCDSWEVVEQEPDLDAAMTRLYDFINEARAALRVLAQLAIDERREP